MAIVTQTPFRRAILSWIRPNLLTFTLRLFVNNVVPAVGQSVSDYVEPGGSWYRPVVLSEWQQPFINPANQAEMAEAVRLFTASGTIVNESVYGYWITNPSGILCWSELAPSGPIPMNSSGAKVQLIPRLYDGALC